MRLRKKLQFEERQQANQRRVLSESETVRWLNHTIEKIWPICMEQIASQQILLPIIPWFLEKYKPWTAKEAVVQHLYLGRNAPILTEMRVVRQSADDDHLVLELGLNFLTADDMIAILAVKLRKRLGFGMWAKLHITGMHVEGKVLIGVKFLRRWPFLGRVRLCFVQPPYFQMTVKPIFTHGLDVTVLPGIAGWLEKLLSIAFEQTLVEPNMLVVDMEKFVSPKQESWFSVNEKEALAHVKVEVIEASDVKAADLNGFSDPYAKGQLGLYRFRTKIQKKTLSPKWHEEFKIPILTWDAPNVLAIEVCDKDRFVDDALGDCSININDLRDSQRHDMWVPLQNIKTGRLHLAVTVIEDNVKGPEQSEVQETVTLEDRRNSFASDANESSFSSISSEKSNRVADNFEPIDVEGQKETGIWVHHPGSEVSQTWESRQGRSRLLDNEILNDTGSRSSATYGSQNNDDSGMDKDPEEKRHMKGVRKGLNKFCAKFHRNSKKDLGTSSFKETARSESINLRGVHDNESGVKFIVEDDLSEPLSSKVPKGQDFTPAGGTGSDTQAKGKLRETKSFFKRNQKSDRKDFAKSQSDSLVVNGREILENLISSDDDPLPK
ncbi:C2 domain-containing protein At1g53590-like isoform X2 [Malus sylvestris]|nr:C2 domain-containing protein At1g53590-like isoform X2 [Malus sylvestris]